VKNAKASSGFFYVGSGIEINNAANGIIENVKSTGNYFYGIYVRDSQNIVIRDSNIHDNGNDGIYVLLLQAHSLLEMVYG